MKRFALLAGLVVVLTAAMLWPASASDVTLNQFDATTQTKYPERFKDNGDTSYSKQAWITGDGTNVAKLGSSANLNAKAAQNALLTSRPGNWVATHAPIVNTAASASQAAAGAGVRNVCNAISGSVVADSTAPAAVILTLNLRDGATGAGSVLATWTLGIEATAGRTTFFNFPDLNIPGTANTAMTLEFTAAGGAHTFESLTLVGTTTQ